MLEFAFEIPDVHIWNQFTPFGIFAGIISSIVISILIIKAFQHKIKWIISPIIGILVLLSVTWQVFGLPRDYVIAKQHVSWLDNLGPLINEAKQNTKPLISTNFQIDGDQVSFENIEGEYIQGTINTESGSYISYYIVRIKDDYVNEGKIDDLYLDVTLHK